MTMKRRFIFLILAMLFCIVLTSCGEEIDVVTEARYSVYENEGSDMISFYMTCDIDKDGKWIYSKDGLKCFDVYLETEETNENAHFQTLILKPTKEGEADVILSLEDGRYCEYIVTVKKDDNGILRITVKDKAIVLS